MTDTPLSDYDPDLIGLDEQDLMDTNTAYHKAEARHRAKGMDKALIKALGGHKAKPKPPKGAMAV